MDRDHDMRISYEEFEQIMAQYLKSDVEAGQLRAAFQIFDVDDSGSISVVELERVLTTLGEKLTRQEVMELVRALGDAVSRSRQRFLCFFPFPFVQSTARAEPRSFSIPPSCPCPRVSWPTPGSSFALVPSWGVGAVLTVFTCGWLSPTGLLLLATCFVFLVPPHIPFDIVQLVIASPLTVLWSFYKASGALSICYPLGCLGT